MTIKKAFCVDFEGFFTLGYLLLLKNFGWGKLMLIRNWLFL